MLDKAMSVAAVCETVTADVMVDPAVLLHCDLLELLANGVV